MDKGVALKIAVLGLGEAGRMYADAYVGAGWSVAGFDPAKTATPQGVHRADDIAEAVSGADLVLGLTTAKHSVGAAQEAAQAMHADALYLDLNAASPETKAEVAEVIGADQCIDGAVIGSVRQYGAQVKVLLAGPRAQRAAELLSTIGADARPVSDEIGAASRRKLLRSVFMKGLGALISESMEAGERSGEVAWMREQIANELAGGEATLDRLNNGTRVHAARRGAELGASLDLLERFPGTWSTTHAAQNRHLELARGCSNLATELAGIPTSALGDGTDRLGFAHSSIKPVWPSAPLAGRAFTVLVSPGDNLAIHAAMREARAGDVIVVSGGGYTDRALMGELMAERAQRSGIAGFVIDGAVRDAEAIAAIGLPVWAAGVTPAGPYKHGPGRLAQTVSIGGAVCAHGDYIVADADGVLVIPALEAESRLLAGQAVLADEAQRKSLMRSDG